MALHRESWWVIDPRRNTGAAIARYPFAWMARFHCAFTDGGMDYARPGGSKIS